MIYVIDEIIDDYAKLQNLDTKKINYEKLITLPQNIHEGATLKYINGQYILDDKTEKERINIITNKLNKLKKNTIKYSNILEDNNINKTFKDITFNEYYDYTEIKSCIIENCDLHNTTFQKLEIDNSKIIKSNLSNFSYNNNSLTNTEINSSNLVGIDFSDAYLENVIFNDCNLLYSSFYNTTLKNVIFNNTKLNNTSFNNIKWKNIELNNCDIDNIELLNMSLNDLDISSCQFKKINVDINKVKGLTVNLEQALQLSNLLGIKIK